MEGGNLDAVGMVGGVDYYTCLSEVRVTGGNLTCSSRNTSNLYADHINISGGSINGSISRENGNESGMYAVHSMYITGGKMSCKDRRSRWSGSKRRERDIPCRRNI